jgi:hypothetical protein
VGSFTVCAVQDDKPLGDMCTQRAIALLALWMFREAADFGLSRQFDKA